ncbi:MAG: hypothetical protein SGI88_03525 [Candidatus Hydrogenedentes bacterium]|nr:hypothetical protein [Candidatus Hydrogenedentota bacterium]
MRTKVYATKAKSFYGAVALSAGSLLLGMFLAVGKEMVDYPFLMAGILIPGTLLSLFLMRKQWLFIEYIEDGK